MADTSASGRRGHAKKGQALPDGSFPITNCSDVRKAVRLAGHAKNPSRARAFIKRRANSLGCPLPDSWK